MRINDPGHGAQDLLLYDGQDLSSDPRNSVLRTVRKWRLTILFVLTSIVVISAAAVFVSRAASDLAISNLKMSAAEETANIAMHVQDMFPTLSAAMVTTDNQQNTPSALDSLVAPGGIPGELPRLLGAFNIVQLNIFDLNGKTVRSTDPGNVGLTKRESTLFQEAAAGGVSSEMVEDHKVAHLDGTVRQIDVLEIYVPLVDGSTGNVIGVLGFYRDVTGDVAAHINDVRGTVRWTTVGAMGGLFLALLGFIGVADHTIGRSHKRELAVAQQRLAEREQAEEALKKSEEQHRELLDNYPDGVVLEIDRKIAYGNPALREITGYTEEEILNVPPEEFLVPEERERAVERIGKLLAGTPRGTREYHILKKDGSVLPTEVTSQLISYAGKSALLSVLRDITERKEAEEALRASEEQHRTLLDFYPDGVLVAVDGKIAYCNPALMEISGYTQEEILDTPPTEFIAPEDRQRASAVVRKLLDGMPGGTQEYRVSKKDGTIMPTEISSRLITYAGKPALLSIIRDITERKRVEGALRVSEELYRSLYNNTPCMMQSVDRDTLVLSVNNYWLEVLGYDRDQVIGRECSQFLSDTSAQYAHEVALPEFRRNGFCKDVELQMVKKNGEVINALFSGVAQRDETGDFTGGFCFLVDVTQRKQAEEALQEAEELYRTLVENSVLGLGIYTPGETFMFGNERLTEIVGYTKEEYESPEFDFMDLFSAEDQGLIADNIRRRLAGEHIPPYEVQMISKDQMVKWVEIHNVFVRYRGRAAMQVQLLDVTERKRVEQRIQETVRLASIGELAAGVAHEINNPLTSVLGLSQLLMAEDLPKNVQVDLQTVHSNAQRAAKVVQNLLSFARKHEPEKSYLDVVAIVQRALEMKSYDFKTSNIQVTSELSALPPTMVDEHQLIQVILNVLANAEQAMRGLQSGGQLVIHSTSSGDSMTISISDNGHGIPKEHLDKIFDPFFTTRQVGEGTGLGLSISYGIIRQHDGHMWAESVPGEGATFYIELPVVVPEGSVESILPRLEQFSTSTKHLLVVDDEPAIRDLLARSLERERYTVDLAEEGGEAWRKVQAQSYDCVILDLKMPGMSGQELYRRIESSDPGLARKVIFITGDTISPDTQNFVTATGNPVLSKPWDMDVLRRQIHDFLEATSNST